MVSAAAFHSRMLNSRSVEINASEILSIKLARYKVRSIICRQC
jgi:hypothetical protein